MQVRKFSAFQLSAGALLHRDEVVHQAFQIGYFATARSLIKRSPQIHHRDAGSSFPHIRVLVCLYS